MDDASLDEFVDASGEDERGEPSNESSGEGRPTSDADDGDAPSEVTPATSTYAWTGDGAVCAACGESAARRWRDGDELVCADCKEW